MPTSPTTNAPSSPAELVEQINTQLSLRHLDLDPAGYFIIFIDPEKHLICAKHFKNTINEQGLATDPSTGQVIPARGKVNRSPQRTFSARTAKELCVEIFELGEEGYVSQLSHAAYLGREFVRAELALLQGSEYIQD